MRLPHGLFGWVDLMSTDVAKARSFYEGLFGWTSIDTPTPMGPVYTTFQKDGKRVAGMGSQPADMAAAGVPSMWSSYVIVDSVDDVLKAADAAGGAVLMPGIDVMTQGRMAMIADPSGGVLGLWQPGDHDGAELFNAPGALAWNELQSRGLESALTFYHAVFGWRWERMEGDFDYYVGHLDTKDSEDTSNCGAMTIPEVAPAEMPSTWMVYFAVPDCDDWLSKAQELGGEVFMPAMDMGPGRFGGITDPTGAMVFLGAFAES